MLIFKIRNCSSLYQCPPRPTPNSTDGIPLASISSVSENWVSELSLTRETHSQSLDRRTEKQEDRRKRRFELQQCKLPTLEQHKWNIDKYSTVLSMYFLRFNVLNISFL